MNASHDASPQYRQHTTFQVHVSSSRKGRFQTQTRGAAALGESSSSRWHPSNEESTLTPSTTGLRKHASSWLPSWWYRLINPWGWHSSSPISSRPRSSMAARNCFGYETGSVSACTRMTLGQPSFCYSRSGRRCV